MRKTDHRDEEALRRLGRAHGRAVRSLVNHREYDPMEVEEIVADVFRLAYEHLPALTSVTDNQARSWLLRTARFLTANHVRRSMSRRRIVDRLAREPLPLAASPDDEFAAADEDAAANARSERVAMVLAALRADYRQVLVMSALGEQGAEIGEELGVSENAARKRLMRARIAFRDAYISAVDGDAETAEEQR